MSIDMDIFGTICSAVSSSAGGISLPILCEVIIAEAETKTNSHCFWSRVLFFPRGRFPVWEFSGGVIGGFHAVSPQLCLAEPMKRCR
jgi:hypothetical protein